MTDTITGKFSWSFDGETFIDLFDTEESAQQAARLQAACSIAQGISAPHYWTAEAVHPIDSSAYQAYSLGARIVLVSNQLFAAMYDLSKAVCTLDAEKTEELGRIVSEFLREHADFDGFTVRNLKLHYTKEEL